MDEIKNAADQIEITIRHNALSEALAVAEVWSKTEAVPGKSDNPPMAALIATVTRTTATKIKEGILALMGQKPPAIGKPEYVQVTCDCDAAGKGCPQGKLDYGYCTVWMRKTK